MKKNILILLFLIMAFTNAIANNNNDTVYTYYDAARNKYVLTDNELEYMPTNARESSSGVYNGGTYESTLLTQKEYEEIVKLFNMALKNKKVHTIKNIKPNTAIEINCNNKKINFILISTSAINISINNYLKKIIKN